MTDGRSYRVKNHQGNLEFGTSGIEGVPTLSDGKIVHPTSPSDAIGKKLYEAAEKVVKEIRKEHPHCSISLDMYVSHSGH